MSSLWFRRNPQSFVNALSFDGVDDYVDMGTSFPLDVTNFITVESWVYPTIDSGGIQVICAKYSSSVSASFRLYQSNKSFAFIVRTTDGITVSSGNFTIPEFNRWYHVVGIFDGTNTYLYINGVLATTSTAVGATTINSVSARTVIGANSLYQTPFQGCIREVRIWKLKRTLAQIQENIDRQLIGNEAGLIGYWTLQEGYGTTAYDKALNKVNGAISGAAWVVRQ